MKLKELWHKYYIDPRKGETNYEECPDKLGMISK